MNVNRPTCFDEAVEGALDQDGGMFAGLPMISFRLKGMGIYESGRVPLRFWHCLYASFPFDPASRLQDVDGNAAPDRGSTQQLKRTFDLCMFLNLRTP
ncbi:hypothetical protein [Shinella sp.]|uniref:hypothetical protein n=1 Tax=Shinella sp. TaxID=1870904 RepID=UPI0025912698|nr:hypothetical protein [Shinella sp.]